MDWLQIVGPALGLANTIALFVISFKLAKKPASAADFQKVEDAAAKALKAAKPYNPDSV